MRPLDQCVCVVTGASRGVGRGIAHELGLAGARVVVTGRSRSSGSATDNLPGTIDDCATLVTESGGVGIPVECDHTDDAEVDALADRLRRDYGCVDLLVNNVWGGYEAYDGSLFTMPVWEQPLWRWDKMMQTGLRAHYTASRALSPLMVGHGGTMIVNISAGDRGKFLGDVQYDVAKAADDRLAFALSRKLGPEGVTVLALHPGFTRTERVVAASPPAEAMATTHSSRFVGMCIVALANDPNVAAKSGKALRAGELAIEYELFDLDGSRPQPFDIPD